MDDLLRSAAAADKEGQYQKALDLLDKAIATDPKAGKPSEDKLNERLFYAHLYLGLFFESEGDAKKALEHLTVAADHKIGHYMWDVARVHRDLLRKDIKKK